MDETNLGGWRRAERWCLRCSVAAPMMKEEPKASGGASEAISDAIRSDSSCSVRPSPSTVSVICNSSKSQVTFASVDLKYPYMAPSRRKSCRSATWPLDKMPLGICENGAPQKGILSRSFSLAGSHERVSRAVISLHLAMNCHGGWRIPTCLLAWCSQSSCSCFKLKWAVLRCSRDLKGTFTSVSPHTHSTHTHTHTQHTHTHTQHTHVYGGRSFTRRVTILFWQWKQTRPSKSLSMHVIAPSRRTLRFVGGAQLWKVWLEWILT